MELFEIANHQTSISEAAKTIAEKNIQSEFVQGLAIMEAISKGYNLSVSDFDAIENKIKENQ